MINQPLVSVIITTYNREHLISRAIESVLSQTYKNIEIIVVDDCSTDGTVEKIKNYKDKIKYIRNVKNVERSASRNIGIRASSGEYLSFLDDDDELLPEKVALQIELFLANKDIDVVYCGSVKKNNGFTLDNPAKLRGEIFPQVLSSCPNAIHTLLIKRECFSVIGLFDEDFNFFEDHDLWVRLSKLFIFDYIDKSLVLYNIHNIQMSTCLRLKIAGMESFLKKHSLAFASNKKYLYWYLRKLASRYALANEYENFRAYILKAWKVNGFIPGTYFHLILSVVCRPLHRFLICHYGLAKIGDMYLV